MKSTNIALHSNMNTCLVRNNISLQYYKPGGSTAVGRRFAVGRSATGVAGRTRIFGKYGMPCSERELVEDEGVVVVASIIETEAELRRHIRGLFSRRLVKKGIVSLAIGGRGPFHLEGDALAFFFLEVGVAVADFGERKIGRYARSERLLLPSENVESSALNVVSVESRGFLYFFVLVFLDLDLDFFLLFDSVVATEASIVDSEASIVDSETMEAFIAASNVAVEGFVALFVLVLVFFVGDFGFVDLDSVFFFFDLTDDDSSFFSFFFSFFLCLIFFLMRPGGDSCRVASNRASNPKSNRESLSQPHFNESPSDDTSDGSSSISTAVTSLLLVVVVAVVVAVFAVAVVASFMLLLLFPLSSRFLQCFSTPSKQE